MQRTATPLTSVRFRSQPPIMNILVTGSSGFIGFHLTKELLKNGHNVIGVDDHNDYYDTNLKEDRLKGLNHENFRFIKSNINNLSPKALGKNVDLIINLAAQAGVRCKDESKYLYKETNEEGFKHICWICKEKKIPKLIYASSSSVYSDQGCEEFSEENTNLVPKSIYGKSKLNNEKYAESFSLDNKISMIGLRFFSVYGPFGRPDMAYYHFTHLLNNDKKITLFNEGMMSRDMTFIDDLISGILGALTRINSKEFCHNEIFNLGNNSPVKTKDLLDKIESILKKKSHIEHKLSTNESKFTNANIEKARKMLNYDPNTTLDIGLRKFIDWYLKYEQKKN